MIFYGRQAQTPRVTDYVLESLAQCRRTVGREIPEKTVVEPM